jgi:hypothetical protein
MRVFGKEVIIRGRIVKSASLANEWIECLEDPVGFLEELKRVKPGLDVFTFRQNLPRTQPEYKYYMEGEDVAVIPISTYDNWLKKQINSGARRAIGKAARLGVEVRTVEFDLALAEGIKEIVNETPIRQGRRYPHYGRNLEDIQREWSVDLEKSIFLGAYWNGELIGFIKLGCTAEYGVPFGMVAKVAHRDKSPQNALVAAAVETCQKKGMKYILYGNWGGGSLGEFKKHIGCERVILPRYYIPLSLRGSFALKLGLHRGLNRIVPERLKEYLAKWRARIYATKYC